MDKQLHDNQHDPAKAWLGYEPNRKAQQRQAEDWAAFTPNETPWEWYKAKRDAWGELHDRLYGDDKAVS